MEHVTLESEDWFDVLLTTDDAQAAVMTLAPGQSTGGTDNRHDRSDQWLYAVSGSATATVDGERVEIEPGDLVVIEAGETHELANEGDDPFESLNLYVPPIY